MALIDEMIVAALTHGSGLQLSALGGADERSEKQVQTDRRRWRVASRVV